MQKSTQCIVSETMEMTVSKYICLSVYMGLVGMQLKLGVRITKQISSKYHVIIKFLASEKIRK